MTLHDDHGTLPHHAENLLSRLEGLRNLFIAGKTLHDQHLRHADRARLLADQLHSVLVLSAAFRYAAALAIARTALEYHLLDLLIFLGDRWMTSYDVKLGRSQGECRNQGARRRDERDIRLEASKRSPTRSLQS